MGEGMKILVIDRDTSWVGAARTTIEAGGHVVEHMEDLPTVDHPARAYVEVILLDWQGVRNAAWWIRKLNSITSTVEVIALIQQCQPRSMLEALDAGISDCLVKPVRPAEVLARLELIGWRRGLAARSVFQLGDVHTELSEHRATRAGATVALTAAEWKLVTVVLSRRGRFVTRAQLESVLAGDPEHQSSNRLEVHISNLRRKLGSDFIETQRGVGYRVQS